MKKDSCSICGQTVARVAASAAIITCHKCRRASPAQRKASPTNYIPPSKRGTCADCGEVMWRGRGSRPQGKAVCLTCRRNRNPPSERPSGCETCGALKPSSRHRYCDACKKHGMEATARRNERDRQAPGPYGRERRRALLLLWKKQGRRCTYCGGACESVDHITPLALGGTNYEGNLAPCCIECNRKKMDNLLSAWRYGIRVRKWRTHVVVTPKPPRPKRQPRPKPVVTMNACTICSAPTPNAKRCSDECRAEWNRRINRDAYRRRMGLPVIPDQPTPGWLAWQVELQHSAMDTNTNNSGPASYPSLLEATQCAPDTDTLSSPYAQAS